MSPKRRRGGRAVRMKVRDSKRALKIHSQSWCFINITRLRRCFSLTEREVWWTETQDKDFRRPPFFPSLVAIGDFLGWMPISLLPVQASRDGVACGLASRAIPYYHPTLETALSLVLSQFGGRVGGREKGEPCRGGRAVRLCEGSLYESSPAAPPSSHNLEA